MCFSSKYAKRTEKVDHGTQDMKGIASKPAPNMSFIVGFLSMGLIGFLSLTKSLGICLAIFFMPGTFLSILAVLRASLVVRVSTSNLFSILLSRSSKLLRYFFAS